MAPPGRQGAELLMGALTEGVIDVAATAEMWPWDGIVGVDVRLAVPDFLLQVRLHWQNLLRWVTEQTEAPTLTEVATRLSDSRTRCLVLAWTTQTLALVPGFCSRRGLPTLGRPPLAYASRIRTQPVRPGDQPHPPGGEPGCQLAEDLTAVVAELAIQPARIRQDWVVRLADSKRLTARLFSVSQPQPSTASTSGRPSA